MKRRNTPTKAAVLTALKSTNTALSHDHIRLRVSKDIDRATIYRILNRFCDDGIVHRIVADDGKQYFALCAGCEHDNHHHNHFHFRCLQCDQVECMTSEISVNLPAGYQTKNFNGVISGRCVGCASD